MAKNFVKPGNIVTVTAFPYARTAGQGVLAGKMFGVALNDVANGAEGEMYTTGIWALTKAASQAWAQWVAIYWDDTNKVCTTTSSGNTFIGHAASVVGSGAGETTGSVRLHGASI